MRSMRQSQQRQISEHDCRKFVLLSCNDELVPVRVDRVGFTASHLVRL